MTPRRLGAGALVLGMPAGADLLVVPTAMAAPAVVHTAGFETGADGWYGRGGSTVAVTTEAARTGAQSLAVTGRTQGWEGPGLNALSLMPAGTYDIEAWVKLPTGAGSDLVTASVARTPVDAGTSYDTVAWQVPVGDADSTRVAGSYTVATDNRSLELYLESPDATQSFFVDDVTIVGEAAAPPPPSGTLPSVSTVFETGLQGWGPRGAAEVAISTDAHTGGRSLLTTNRLDDWQGPTLDITENLAVGQAVQVSLWAKLASGQAPASLKVSIQRDRAGASTAYEKVAGPSAVVSATQTPDWFFTDTDGTPLTSSPEDQALLRSRMETHIKAIADHIAARYPDGDSPVWAWDVVNEVINDSDDANPHDMRDSRWFQVLGETFVDDAFRFADEYFPQAELFINDYTPRCPPSGRTTCRSSRRCRRAACRSTAWATRRTWTPVLAVAVPPGRGLGRRRATGRCP